MDAVYKIKVPKCDDSNKFRQAAINFETYGYYTSAPVGTTAYLRYWDEELRRCIFGYKTEDGEYISGYFYFYLNYSRIIVTKETHKIDILGRKRRVSDRPESFPRYYDYDRAYFDAIEEAEQRGRHLVTIKKRGAGYSFKGASMLCRNFFCIPKSKSYVIASEAEFLTKDGTLTKAWDMMSFIDTNTAFGKRRQKKDTVMHKRASFVIKADDESGIVWEAGYKSEIIGVSLKNDPQKARGKRAKLILWEEAGKFPGLKESWQIARPSVEDGTITFGLMIAYGTGGTVDADYEGLKDLFYEPDAYNALPIQNIWDDGALDGKPCGFFVPEYYNMSGKDEFEVPFMDEFGNSNVEVAKVHAIKQRDIIIESSSDKTSIDRYIAERPFTPMEATLQISGNIFPKKDIIRHLAEIRNSNKMKEFKQVGDLYMDPAGLIKWEINKKYKDLTKYRVSANDDPAGAIVIWEHPPEEIPYGLYVIGCDSYDYDQSTTDSLGSAIVYKRFQNFEAYYDLPVAEYTGRPEKADIFYEKVRLLGMYYSAKIMYENQNKGIFDYFLHKKCDYMLADQPDIIRDVVGITTVQRIKGCHMNKPLKIWGIGLLKDWLNEEYAPGRKNLTKIFSEALLEELIAYNDNGNFDRVMAMIQVMIYLRELYSVTVKRNKDISKVILFKDGIFRNN
jgi:hypothetical protein